MSNAFLLDDVTPAFELENLDLDVRISLGEPPVTGENAFGTPGGYTSPNLTHSPQSLCPTCCW